MDKSVYCEVYFLLDLKGIFRSTFYEVNET